MANNTALRAGKDTTRTITFKNKEHEKFYYTYLPKCRYQDVYHKALVYCLGIDRDTRENAEQIYDFKTGYVKTECLHEGWQTSGSVRIVRLAFNLYCDGTPSVYAPQLGMLFIAANSILFNIANGRIKENDKIEEGEIEDCNKDMVAN